MTKKNGAKKNGGKKLTKIEKKQWPKSVGHIPSSYH